MLVAGAETVHGVKPLRGLGGERAQSLQPFAHVGGSCGRIDLLHAQTPLAKIESVNYQDDIASASQQLSIRPAIRPVPELGDRCGLTRLAQDLLLAPDIAPAMAMHRH